MLLKYIVSALGSVFFSRRSGLLKPDPLNLEALSKELRLEIMAFSAKFLFGVVLVFLAIFSLAKLGNTFELYLKQLPNGQNLELLAFVGILVLSLGTLFWLFHRTPSDKKKSVEETPKIGKSFIQGFKVGVLGNRLNQQLKLPLED
jgi:hypothetical protein